MVICNQPDDESNRLDNALVVALLDLWRGHLPPRAFRRQFLRLRLRGQGLGFGLGLELRPAVEAGARVRDEHRCLCIYPGDCLHHQADCLSAGRASDAGNAPATSRTLLLTQVTSRTLLLTQVTRSPAHHL